jgi:hypothetical protein
MSDAEADLIFKDGRRSAYFGLPESTCSHPHGSEKWAIWMDGWKQGRQSRMEGGK